MLTVSEQQQYETCIRHGYDFFPAMACPQCERDRKAASVAAYAARRRWEAEANGMPPPVENYPDISYDDYDEDEEYHPRLFPLPLPEPDDVKRSAVRIVAAVLFVGALLIGWMIGYRLNLWGYPL